MVKAAVAGLLVLSILVVPTGAQETDTVRREIINKINSHRISVDFQEVPLEEALNFVREYAGLNIVVDPEVTSRLGEDELMISMKVKNLLLKSVLKLMLDTRGLTMMYKDGVLLVVPKDRIYREVKTQIYDVRDMLMKIQDFPGPKVELTAPGNSATPLAGAMFTLDEPKSTITEDFLVEVIRQNTGGDSWDENENASITLINGMLIVTQSTKVHREIWRVLQLLRQFQ